MSKVTWSFLFQGFRVLSREDSVFKHYQYLPTANRWPRWSRIFSICRVAISLFYKPGWRGEFVSVYSSISVHLYVLVNFFVCAFVLGKTFDSRKYFLIPEYFFWSFFIILARCETVKNLKPLNYFMQYTEKNIYSESCTFS